MTQKEYIKKVSEIDEQMSALRKKRIAIRKQYIEDNKPYPIGTKVRVFDKSNGSVQYGFVVGYDLSFYGAKYDAKIYPKVKKMKKDGTMSQVNMCIWSCMSVEACND
jgi:hypothetical protein